MVSGWPFSKKLTKQNLEVANRMNQAMAVLERQLAKQSESLERPVSSMSTRVENVSNDFRNLRAAVEATHKHTLTHTHTHTFTHSMPAHTTLFFAKYFHDFVSSCTHMHSLVTHALYRNTHALNCQQMCIVLYVFYI